MKASQEYIESLQKLHLHLYLLGEEVEDPQRCVGMDAANATFQLHMNVIRLMEPIIMRTLRSTGR